jgi:hypothetical protein
MPVVRPGSVTNVSGSSRSAGEWRAYLSGYSDDVLGVADEDELTDVSEAQRTARWLGYDGATPEQLAALEQRLGTALPPSYRSFLAVSDGWLNISTFMWTMRTTGEVDWLRDADPELWDILGQDEASPIAGRALLVSGQGDGQYWLLDPGDVAADGEWAAYIWASWYPGLGERHDSFAALVDAERASFEELSGRAGRPVQPAGAAALVAQGRELALRGDADAAREVFGRAAEKGSGAGAYLETILAAFLELDVAHHRIRNTVLANPHVIEEIGREQVRAEAVALFLHRERIPPFRQLLAGLLTDDEIRSAAGFAPPVLAEPPEFQAALERARRLLRDGQADQAWLTIRDALPGWHSAAPYRIAPMILLTDPELRRLITPERARVIVTTPRITGRLG